jgi:hypothetical protein
MVKTGMSNYKLVTEQSMVTAYVYSFDSKYTDLHLATLNEINAL